MALEAWDSGNAYEQYVGRWSRRIAVEFLHWLALPQRLGWADIGCGTGALTAAIAANCRPSSVHGIDSSNAFISLARQHLGDGRVGFGQGDAAHLPCKAASFDAAVSGLVLNFVPDHQSMIGEMVRVTKPGGVVAVYVWDYAGGMEMMRLFWDAAVAASPNDALLDEATRFPLCRPEPLGSLFENGGLKSVEVRAIEIATIFQNFDDFWRPFLGNVGAGPVYLAGVGDETRERIRLSLENQLAAAPDGKIELSARAWAVRGVV